MTFSMNEALMSFQLSYVTGLTIRKSPFRAKLVTRIIGSSMNSHHYYNQATDARHHPSHAFQLVVLGLVPVAVACCSEAGRVVADDLKHCRTGANSCGKSNIAGAAETVWATHRTPNMLLWRIG